MSDFCGTKKEAVKYAEEQAEISGGDIYINCGENIIDIAFA